MRSGGGLPLALVHGTHAVDINPAARGVREQLRRVQPPERLLRDEQCLPDPRRRVLDLLVSLGRGRPQPVGREGRLHRVRGPQMLPVLARELIERHHPLPVAIEDAPDFSMTALRAPRLKRALLPLGLLPRLGVRDLREQTPRFRLPCERQRVEHVQQAMIPAPLLLRLRKHRGQRTPDPEVTIADHTFGAASPRRVRSRQIALRRAIEGADRGAPSPSSPRKARSKSPWASPGRYNSGSNRPTSSVRRLNAGSSRLSKRSLSPRTRGRRRVIVAVAQAQPPWLAEAVAVARNGIDTVAPFVPRPPEHAVHLFFQHPLQELLHALPREAFQRLPGRACFKEKLPALSTRWLRRAPSRH